MVKRNWFYIPAALLLVMMLSGCSFITDPVQLMKTPELSAEKESLRSIIEANRPENSTLIRANAEEDTNIIHFVDLDNDGVNEAVVFYETSEQNIGIHGMIFKKIGDAWEKQTTFDGEGKVLESLYFKDMTNDGHMDIVIGFPGKATTKPKRTCKTDSSFTATTAKTSNGFSSFRTPITSSAT